MYSPSPSYIQRSTLSDPAFSINEETCVQKLNSPQLTQLAPSTSTNKPIERKYHSSK